MMAHSTNGRAERFRELLASTDAMAVPGCYDVLSGILLEEAGFPVVFLSGFGAAASQFGNPDIGLTSLTETATLARSLIGAVNAPVLVDADNGYGNEDNVVRTVYELELAGAAGMIMEDQVLPKRCGHTDAKTILPLPLYMKKLTCALKARQTPMVVVARTDATDIDDGIARAKAFHSAGADLTLVDGLRSRHDIERVAAEVPGHKQINLIYGGKTPILSVRELGAMGFKIILYSTPALFAVVRTMRQQMRRLFEAADLNSISPDCVAFSEFQALIEAGYHRRPHVGALDGPGDR